MRKVLVAVVGACLLFLGITIDTARANDIRVCAPGETVACAQNIQIAVDKAQPNSTILLGNGVYEEYNIVITKNITIRGADPQSTIIQAAAQPCAVPYRVFTVVAARVTFENLTVRNGCTSVAHEGGAGGGIWSAGTLRLRNVVVTQNVARIDVTGAVTNAVGGGIFSSGALDISTSTIIGNRSEISVESAAMALGGGVYNNGDATILNSTISANAVSDGINNRPQNITGGGIYNEGSLNLVFNTFAYNSAGQEGGGINNVGELHLTNNLWHNNISLAGNARDNCVTVGGQLNKPCDTPIDPNIVLGQLITNTIVPVYQPSLDSSSVNSDKCVRVAVVSDQLGSPRYQGKRCDLGAVENGASFIPLAIALPDMPDLVVRDIIVEPSRLDTNTPATIKVVIQNIGSEAAIGSFWVDLYINPVRNPPIYAGTTWKMLCRTVGCGGDKGIAWTAPATIRPNQTVVLTSQIDDPYVFTLLTQWDDYFPEGTNQVWAFVDSYGGTGASSGVIAERDETNNRVGPIAVRVDRGLGVASGTQRPAATPGDAPEGLPVP